jgi:acetyl-CoA C-acetyltransferase
MMPAAALEEAKAGERQVENPRIGLTHNLGGFPCMSVVSVALFGNTL